MYKKSAYFFLNTTTKCNLYMALLGKLPAVNLALNKYIGQYHKQVFYFPYYHKGTGILTFYLDQTRIDLKILMSKSIA